MSLSSPVDTDEAGNNVTCGMLRGIQSRYARGT
jgi:hypothetical protein